MCRIIAVLRKLDVPINGAHGSNRSLPSMKVLENNATTFMKKGICIMRLNVYSNIPVGMGTRIENK